MKPIFNRAPLTPNTLSPLPLGSIHPEDWLYDQLRTQADGFSGDIRECDEGELQWVSRAFLDALPTWEGDRIFLDLMWRRVPFFSLKLRYEGERLAEAVLNGKPLSISKEP